VFGYNRLDREHPLLGVRRLGLEYVECQTSKERSR
jgi:hypothetical protein